VKYILPKISRILAVRREKLSASHQGVESVNLEHQQVGVNSDHVLTQAFSVSKTLFHQVFTQTNQWVATTVKSVNQTHYKTLNKSYIDVVGELSLSQNILVYHASQRLPEKLAVKFLMEKMKTLKISSENSSKKLPVSK
jgi:hypothetical protein